MPSGLNTANAQHLEELMFKRILAAVFATAAIATPVATTAAAATTTSPQAVIFHGSPSKGGTLADGSGPNVIFHG
jgi:hypothetical protein